MITDVFAPEPEQRFLTKTNTAALLLGIRGAILAGDTAVAAEALEQIAERLVAEDQLLDRLEAEEAGWVINIH